MRTRISHAIAITLLGATAALGAMAALAVKQTAPTVRLVVNGQPVPL